MKNFRKNWNYTTLGSVFNNRKETNHNNEELLSVTRAEGVVKRNSLERRDTSNKDKSKYLLLKKGDIAYNTMRMWQGVSGLSDYRGIVSPAYTICSPTEKIDPKFAGFLLKDPGMITLFKQRSQGLVSDTWSLKFEKFAQIPCSLPPLSEQKKIANILSDIEQYLKKMKNQISKLETLKEGLKEKLLKADYKCKNFKNSTIGKIAENWQIKSLSKLVKITASSVDKKIKDKDIPIKLCNYVDVFKNSTIKSEITFMNSTASIKEIQNFKIHKGDILMTKDSEVPEDIGIPSVVSDEINNLICGYHLYLLRPLNSNICPEYLCWVLRSSNCKKYFYKMANGSTRFGLNLQFVKKCLIPLPDLSEQKKIAKILCDLELDISNKKIKFQKTMNLLNCLKQDFISGRKKVNI